MQFDELHENLKSIVTMVFCDNRFPGSSAPFNSDRTEYLLDRGVTVEACGEINNAGALLTFLLVPVSHYEYFASGNRGPQNILQSMLLLARIRDLLYSVDLVN
jgi:hypothetical protein